jgi:hypothetical protein
MSSADKRTASAAFANLWEIVLYWVAECVELGPATAVVFDRRAVAAAYIVTCGVEGEFPGPEGWLNDLCDDEKAKKFRSSALLAGVFETVFEVKDCSKNTGNWCALQSTGALQVIDGGAGPLHAASNRIGLSSFDGFLVTAATDGAELGEALSAIDEFGQLVSALPKPQVRVLDAASGGLLEALAQRPARGPGGGINGLEPFLRELVEEFKTRVCVGDPPLSVDFGFDCNFSARCEGSRTETALRELDAHVDRALGRWAAVGAWRNTERKNMGRDVARQAGIVAGSRSSARLVRADAESPEVE